MCSMPVTGICRGCCAPWMASAKPSWRRSIPIRPRPYQGVKQPTASTQLFAGTDPAGGALVSVVGARGGEGEVVADYLKQRVWLWDGSEQRVRCWHLLAHREIDGSKLMFLAKERLAHRNIADLLSCNDLVAIMRHKLPTKIETDADLAASIEDRH